MSFIFDNALFGDELRNVGLQTAIFLAETHMLNAKIINAFYTEVVCDVMTRLVIFENVSRALWNGRKRFT